MKILNSSVRKGRSWSKSNNVRQGKSPCLSCIQKGMTKERKLAIEQFALIRKELQNGTTKLPSSLMFSFCKSYGLDWRSNCYFCQYVGCRKCPIAGFDACEDGLYGILTDGHVETAEKVKACDKIIEALKGEYKSEAWRYYNDR